ncbi:hypothetical protein PCAR4_1340019 [Paraburkholderia caribensis]|nr:hypothetical protein PCAR4_1340019 [Paraburkholderia caribensis]
MSRRLRAAPRDVGHIGHGASEGCQTLSRLNPNECLHRDPKQIGFIHLWISKLERTLVKVIINRNRGPHTDSPIDAVSHQS